MALDLGGRTMGIVGMGNVGKAIFKHRASIGFGLEVVANTPVAGKRAGGCALPGDR